MFLGDGQGEDGAVGIDVDAEIRPEGFHLRDRALGCSVPGAAVFQHVGREARDAGLIGVRRPCLDYDARCTTAARADVTSAISAAERLVLDLGKGDSRSRDRTEAAIRACRRACAGGSDGTGSSRS